MTLPGVDCSRRAVALAVALTACQGCNTSDGPVDVPDHDRFVYSSADWNVSAAAPSSRPRGAERLESEADRVRYRYLATQIHSHLHRGAHFQRAVTVGTIKELRRL